MKIAMINTHSALKEANLDAKMTLQVHDELIIESSPKETKLVVEIVKKSMSKAAKLSVPLEVDIGIGKNWDQAH
jgi:DNA polymerase-1